jgi:choice-of-anchor C domain-containing protein
VAAVVALVPGAVVAAAWAGGNAVGNGSFERPAIRDDTRFFPGGSRIGAWSVRRGGVDLLAGRFQAADGRQSVDLNGGGAGAVRQELHTPVPAYKLLFALAGNPECGEPVKRVAVFWDRERIAVLSFDTTGRSAADMGWEWHLFPVTASGSSTRLELVSLTGGACGPAIDGVSAFPGR